MYAKNDRDSVKSKVYKTLLDGYQAKEVDEAISLIRGMDVAKFVRQAILNEVERFHEAKSIGRQPPQQDFFKNIKRA